MESPLRPILANISMSKFETQVEEKIVKAILYRKNIVENLFMSNNKDDYEILCDSMNQMHKNVQLIKMMKLVVRKHFRVSAWNFVATGQYKDQSIERSLEQNSAYIS